MAWTRAGGCSARLRRGRPGEVAPTLVRGGLVETGLELTDEGAELARREKSGPERARRVPTDRRKRSQGVADLRRRLVELPADLLVDSLRPVRAARPAALAA